MNTAFKYGGWLAAVVLLICVGLLLSRPIQTNEVVLDVAHTTPASQATEDAAALAELESVKAEKAVLEAELAQLKAALENSEAEAEVDATPPIPAPEEPTAEKEEPQEEADGDRAAVAQLSIVADMMYKQLFDELNLTPELRSALKEPIARHLLAMRRETMEAMGAKTETAKSVKARMDAMKAALRNDLAATLTPEGLAAWDEYAPVADQLLYERMVDGQLSMMASGLSNDNRVLASQVMAEELVREFDAFDQSDDLYTLDNFNAAQTRALNTSLDRLAGELEDDQFSEVRGFVEQAFATFEASAGR